MNTATPTSSGARGKAYGSRRSGSKLSEDEGSGGSAAEASTSTTTTGHREDEDDDSRNGNANDDSTTLCDGSSAAHGKVRNKSGDSLYSSSSSSCDGGEIRKMSDSETRRIRLWRGVVLAAVFVAGVAATAGTYLYLRSQQRKVYLSKYQVYAGVVNEAAAARASNARSALRDVADAVTLSALRRNSTFPFHTFEYFEMTARRARKQGGSHFLLSVLYAPLVDELHADEWDRYASENVAGWLEESRLVAMEDDRKEAQDKGENGELGANYDTDYDAVSPLVRGEPLDDSDAESKGYRYAPTWQASPLPDDAGFVNDDLLRHGSVTGASTVAGASRAAIAAASGGSTFTGTFTDASQLPRAVASVVEQDEGDGNGDDHRRPPYGALVQPVYSKLNRHGGGGAEAVGMVHATLAWDGYLEGLQLPGGGGGAKGLYCVVENTCGDAFTYRIDGTANGATFIGDGDLHEEEFSNTARVVSLDDPALEELHKNLTGTDVAPGHCSYAFTTYSSREHRDSAMCNTPAIITAVVALIFLLLAAAFVVYDSFVQRRNRMILRASERANSILSSLFPKKVRDRLFKEKEEQAERAKLKKNTYAAPKSHLNNFLRTGAGASGDFCHLGGDGEVDDDDDDEIIHSDKPIADLFTDTTVLFADIAGFTAWSSVREPAQVFILLETVYHAFDVIAKRRRIFKVETIGDCYVAVSGLPDPRKDHAIAMSRFARDIIHKFQFLTKKLEVKLGPDTGDLDLRVGLHSGPVTAGVLRGDRRRFQLFGDTMNTASRMESTGMKGQIQVSDETAELLTAGGKERWLTPREGTVDVKGKGKMATFWLTVGATSGGMSTTGRDTADSRDDGIGSDKDDVASVDTIDLEEKAQARELELQAEKMGRLVDWNVEVLVRLLKHIVARRNATRRKSMKYIGHSSTSLTKFGSSSMTSLGIGDNNSFCSLLADEDEVAFRTEDKRTFDEVKEIINLPTFDAEAVKRQEDINDVQLSPKVTEQLYCYVENVAEMYNDNPFHNFEHASHVSMSVNKLLSRIVAPDIDYREGGDCDDDDAMNDRLAHDHTYGITSDPLTQFACVFSALIHDADHQGVPNAQLVKEGAYVSKYYNGKSVAEQNSVDMAWGLLMQDEFRDLRTTIYGTPDELRRFRQLVVNAVMATDIMDKDLKMLRNARWAKAFATSDDGDDALNQHEDPVDAANRKATIVIEHLIQASDIAHTMQHWHIYRKWNERFFIECMKAFKEGRAEKDPAEGWYQGEIGFFDFYIIPLARKLKDCGVFGVSSDEYLTYAIRNRQEWELRGKEVVDELIEIVNKRNGGGNLLQRNLPKKQPVIALEEHPEQNKEVVARPA